MPNGLLFVLLAVMWAVVLIPMWLRKHDESNESRSVDRFSRALGSLSARLERGQDADGQETVVVHRPSKAPSGREVLMPGRPRGSQSADVVVTGASARQVARTPVSAAGRRRRVLVGLLVLALALLTAGLAHAVPLWTAVVPVVVAGILVVTARRQAALRAEMARRRVRRTELTDAARAAQSDRPVARRGSRAVMPASAAAADGEQMRVEHVEVDVMDGSWHAVPTTLPTYVTAPTATAVPRVIDRDSAGAWSGAVMLEQARSSRHEEAADDSGMRVESFEISVPRERAVPAAEAQRTAYSQRYVDVDAGSAELEATDDEAVLTALLADPRTGVSGQRAGYRRAAG